MERYTMDAWKDFLAVLSSDIFHIFTRIRLAIKEYQRVEPAIRRAATLYILVTIILIVTLIFLNNNSADFVLGGLLAILAGFLGAHHSGKLQAKRDNSQLLRDVAAIRKALRSELYNIWETYKESVGDEIENYDQMTNPYSPKKGYTPHLQHYPILMGVSPKVGLIDPQELSWVNRTYATLSSLQQAFKVVDTCRDEQARMPLGKDLHGYAEVLARDVKHAQQNIHALHSAAKMMTTITLRLLGRPLDKMGTPIGPGPFEDNDPQPNSQN